MLQCCCTFCCSKKKNSHNKPKTNGVHHQHDIRGWGGNWDRWNYIGGLGLVWPIGTKDETMARMSIGWEGTRVGGPTSWEGIRVGRDQGKKVN
jgi:hypothetical protein